MSVFVIYKVINPILVSVRNIELCWETMFYYNHFTLVIKLHLITKTNTFPIFNNKSPTAT